MKFKEFFSRYQLSAEGRHQMGVQMQENLKEKYIKSGASQLGYSMDEFLKIRSTQMHQLHNVYGELKRGNCKRVMRPRSISDTSEDALRRVTGNNMTYNNGFIALDQNDRSIVSMINIETRNSGLHTDLDFYQVEKIVNSVESLHKITEQAVGQLLPIHKIISESDVLKTEMSQVSHEYNSETYGKYTTYNPPSKSFLSKMFKAIDKASNPEKYAEMEKRFDNQEVPGIE